MQVDAFQITLQEFNAEHSDRVKMDLPSRVDKQYEETCEFAYAVAHGMPEEIKDEALDCLICAFQNCIAAGIHNPLYFAYLKLMKNSERYREEMLKKE